MNNQLKQKIKKRMMVILKAKGYPNMTKKQIDAICPRLWDSVKTLINPESGFGYDEFLMVIQQEYTKSKLQGK